MSDILWTNAINASSKKDIATTMLFNKTMSRYFMDLEFFDINSSGVFRVRFGDVHLYYVSNPCVSIRQPDMTSEWFQDIMNFCSTVSFVPDNNNTPSKEIESTIPCNNSLRIHWKPDQTDIVSTKRSSRKPIMLYDTNNNQYSDPQKSLSAKKGHLKHDETIMKTLNAKIDDNNELLEELLSRQSLKHKKDQEKEKANACKN